MNKPLTLDERITLGKKYAEPFPREKLKPILERDRPVDAFIKLGRKYGWDVSVFSTWLIPDETACNAEVGIRENENIGTIGRRLLVVGYGYAAAAEQAVYEAFIDALRKVGITDGDEA